MMFCPNCGQKVAEEETLCPHCNQSLSQPEPEAPVVAAEPVETDMAEEISAESVEADVAEESAAETVDAEVAEESVEDAESAEEATEAADEEAAGAAEETAAEAPKKKRSPLAILAGVIIALLVIIVIALGVALKQVSDGKTLPSLSSLFSSTREEKLDAEATALTLLDQNGETAAELDNRMLSFYYWGEYYYFVNTYGFQFDSTLPLEDQVYEEVTDSATGETTVTTWEDYFLDCASYSITQVEAMKLAGEAAGFQMPEAYLTEYNSILESMATNAASAGFVDEAGNGDALAYIQDSYGSCATIEYFEQYLYDSYYASAYSDEVYNSFTYTTEELEAYFEENKDYFVSYGIEKSDVPNVNVRHILIQPETAEDGTISDEAWEAAEEEANRILEEWKSGDATEDSFATLAGTYSTDGGSSTNGGLYEGVYPGQMLETFNDWCFDPDRQNGDTDIVKTEYGYHIMYFVSHTEEYYYLTVAESDMRYYEGNGALEDITAQYTAVYTEDANTVYPSAVNTIMATESTT